MARIGPQRPQPDFIAPREVEHPVLPLSEASARPLVWVQPLPMRPAYELWAGDVVVATLRYRGLQQREALACAAEGVWTFDTDDAQPSVRILERDRLAGRFVPDEGVLRLADGRSFRWRVEHGEAALAAFERPTGAPVVRFASELSNQARLRVEVAEEEASCVTLLALVGCYHLLAAPRLAAPRSVVDSPLSKPQPLHRS